MFALTLSQLRKKIYSIQLYSLDISKIGMVGNGEIWYIIYMLEIVNSI